MLKIYKTEEQIIEEREQLEEGVWVQMTSPSMEESQKIADYFDIDITDIRAALDDEESSRIELEDGYTLILVDIPSIEVNHDVETYITVPLGILLTQGAIITVCTEETPVLQHFVKRRVRDFSTKKKMRFVYQILFQTAALYQSDLRIIDKKSDIVEKELYKSPRNQELIEILELQKSLVYFTTSLRSNEVVLEKLLKSEKIKKYPEDTDLLDDVIIENKQAIEMANIYSGILSGTMDAFASVISNNLNIVMKFLATITIVMSIPTMVSSFYGMNVLSSSMPFATNPYGFVIVIVLSVILTCAVAWIFAKRNLF